MEYFLNDTQVAMPDGINGLYFSKPRHSLYWGFTHSYFGSAKGIGQVTFSQPDAVFLIDAVQKKKLTDAEMSFRIMDGMRTVINSQLDFTLYTQDRDKRYLSVIDAEGDLFEKQSNVSFQIVPTRQILIPKTDIADTSDLKINETFATIADNKGGPDVFISHALPLKKGDTSLNGKSQDVENPAQLSAFYLNDTGKDRDVTVEIYLKATVLANITIAPKLTLEVRDGSKQIVRTIQLNTLNITNATSTKIIASTERVNVPNGGDLILSLKSSTGLTSYSIKYENESYVALNDDNTPDSFAYGFYANELFAKILEKMTNGKLSFSSPFLASKNYFITNGRCLMSQQTPLKTSFEWLFAAINAIIPLKLDISGSTVVITSRIESISSKKGYFLIKNLVKAVYTVDSDRLYKEVTAGFKTWKSNTPTGNDERNSILSFTTDLKRAPQTLNLTSELIASSRLIEKTRRQQFYESLKNKKRDNSLDESIFIISSMASVAKTDYSGSTLVLNSEFSPEAIAQNWYYLWRQSGNLTLSTSSAAYQDADTLVIKPKLPALLEPKIALVNCIIETEEFFRMGDVVAIDDPDNGRKFLFILTAEHRPFKRGGEHNTFLTAITLV